MPILTPEERVGTSLGGKYRLERILAQGGMGTVFAGVHEWTHRPVAVKVLNYEYARDPEIARRFLQEARAAAQLKHPNVVDVLDMGEEPDGSVYLVLELLEGETLKMRMRRGPLALEEIVEVLGPIMRALASAHRKGVVHRDLKPDNIFLSVDESGERVPKLLDFGIAKIGNGESSATRTGTMVGTPHYMAPEQVRGERDVGPAADVWSMGVVLYACLAGRLPFEADSTVAVLAKVITERPVPLLAVAPELPSELGALVDRALQPKASDRFADMAAMLEAFGAAVAPYVGSAVAPAPPSLPPPAPAETHPAAIDVEMPVARRSIVVPAIAAGALMLAAATVGVLVLSSGDPPAEVPAVERSPASMRVEPAGQPEVTPPAEPLAEPADEATVAQEPEAAPEPPELAAEPPESEAESPAPRRAGRSPRRGPTRGTRGALILR